MTPPISEKPSPNPELCVGQCLGGDGETVEATLRQVPSASSGMESGATTALTLHLLVAVLDELLALAVLALFLLLLAVHSDLLHAQ